MGELWLVYDGVVGGFAWEARSWLVGVARIPGEGVGPACHMMKLMTMIMAILIMMTFC
jgi:hypothetical protein